MAKLFNVFIAKKDFNCSYSLIGCNCFREKYMSILSHHFDSFGCVNDRIYFTVFMGVFDTDYTVRSRE